MNGGLIPLPTDVRWRRVVLLALFLAFVFAFRHLAPVFVCGVLMVRILGYLAEAIQRRVGLGRRRSILAVLALGASGLVVAAAVSAQRAAPHVRALRVNGRARVDELLHAPALVQIRHLFGHDGEGAEATVKAYAHATVKYATAFAHVALFLLIGFLLALIYLFEKSEVDEWIVGLVPESLTGTLVRWGGYVADAVVITVRIQAVTAGVNALITLPVLFALKLPHIPLLFLLILLSGLVPVVGNFVAGVVLSLVAFETRGAWAVFVFVGVTFVLHKIESYYLTPRLAAQHVKLPALVLVVSLLLFEQVFGFVGLFLSFPTLYVGVRIRNEWRAGDSGELAET